MGGLVCHQLGFLSEERETEGGEERVVVKTENAPGKGAGAEWGTAGGDPRMLEEVAAGVHSGPHGSGEGGFLPAAHLAALPVPDARLLEVGRTPSVTRCPLGTGSVTESLLDTGSPGGTGVPSGSRGQACTEPRLGKRPRGQPQITRVHLAPRWRGVAGDPAFPGWGWCCQRPQPGDGKCGPLISPSGGHSWVLLSLFSAKLTSPLCHSGPRSPAPHSPVDAGPTNTAKVRARARSRAGSRTQGPTAHHGGGLGSGNLRGAESGAWSLDARVFELRELARAGAPGRQPPAQRRGRAGADPRSSFRPGALPGPPPQPS